MNQNNFKAGFICDTIANVISQFRNNLDGFDPGEKTKLYRLEGLLKFVTSFDVEFPFEYTINHDNLNPVLSVINNIIVRGLPTKAPLKIEHVFEECGLIQENQSNVAFDFKEPTFEIQPNQIIELLHIVEPDLNIPLERYEGELGSNFEWEFLESASQRFPFIKQILEPQRDFSTISPNMHGGRTVDFSYSSPYYEYDNELETFTNKSKGIVIEVDGSHHRSFDYKIYDDYRDNEAMENGFRTFRIRQLKELEDETNFLDTFGRGEFRYYSNNFNKNIEDYLQHYTLTFVPLAVGRILKTLVEILLNDTSYLQKEEIKIGIVERDFPCGALAITIFQEFVNNLNGLLQEVDQLQLPKLNTVIYSTGKFVYDPKLHLDFTIQNEGHFRENFDRFDILIDHSILRRSKIFKENTFATNNAIKIRSAHYEDNSYGSNRRTFCSSPLKFKKLVNKNDDGSFEPIPSLLPFAEYLLQNIFRKIKYREGQLPIISRALQLEPVIGLLPTGGGKSLTFQLPAFLQPGLCMVVNPIKSLMEDQVRVLKSNWIDCCDYINSNIDRKIKEKRLVQLQSGEIMFLFISPERFVMEEFRSLIKNIGSANRFGLSFNYCVIDEVHCVSEWGHDFRSTYLMLGKNAQVYSHSRLDTVCLVGLTATASFDVLADIERELQIKSDDLSNSLVMIENTIRPELMFRVTKANNTRLEELNSKLQSLSNDLDKINDEATLRESIRHHYDEFESVELSQAELTAQTNKIGLDLIEEDHNKNAIVIFCPTKGLKRNTNGTVADVRSVHFVFENLKSNSKGYYHGTDGEKDPMNKLVQQSFEEFTGGKLSHMVCTKAFGMGIDKSDIRSTFHYYYSSSLESLVQEVGRSGRDGKVSLANIFISEHKYFRISHKCLLQAEPNSSEFSPITNTFYRSRIRMGLLRKTFLTKEKCQNAIVTLIDELRNPPIFLINRLKKFIVEIYDDREVHNSFHHLNFKGIDTEKSQIYNLFKEPEFEIGKNDKNLEKEYFNKTGEQFYFKFWESKSDRRRRLYISNLENNDVGYINLVDENISPQPGGDLVLNDILMFLKSGQEEEESLVELCGKKVELEIPNQLSLKEEFEMTGQGEFKFILGPKKKHAFSNIEVCELLNINPDLEINPPDYIVTYGRAVEKAFEYSFDFEDFILCLEEIGNAIKKELLIVNKRTLRFLYNRDRNVKDTGRIIYRMHSMGLISDYTIDYVKNNLFICKMIKNQDVEYYLKNVDEFLRRYLSENSVIDKMNKLRERCSSDSVLWNIREILYFLCEFSQKEIVDKRKRATDEIEKILNESISERLDTWLEQNKYLKEQIYYYFNAKYARIGFKIDSADFSLLDDYEKIRRNELYAKFVFKKYLDVFNKEGTAQNNYKHMIGSCKKILRSLPETDFRKEWLLRLLHSFSLFSINIPSYVKDATIEMEKGLQNLYSDIAFHNNNYNLIEEVIELYEQNLRNNIENEDTFKTISKIKQLVRIKKLDRDIDSLNQYLKTNQKTINKLYDRAEA